MDLSATEELDIGMRIEHKIPFENKRQYDILNRFVKFLLHLN